MERARTNRVRSNVPSDDDSVGRNAPQPAGTATYNAPGITQKRNAFTELMSMNSAKHPKVESAKEDEKSHPHTKRIIQHPRDPRSGLLAYILRPESFPGHVVLRTTSHTVLIQDLYPKAIIHLLLLPRSETHRNMHPHEAFADPEFLSLIKNETRDATELAASELSRLISPYSTLDKARNDALDSSNPPAVLPTGRDFMKDLQVGIHAHPSMSHLHIHIISKDMYSECLRHKKHYNSFNTPFFIPLEDYPLADDDNRRSTSYQNANLKSDYVCWRCGKGFANKFKDLKEHLHSEYEEWRME